MNYFARFIIAFVVCGIAIPAKSQTYDLVINNGRVIDPATKLDAVRHVGVKDGKIEAVSQVPLSGAKVIDASGLIVAPGFIDLHAHGQNIPADRMQAFDGVTTAFELESGILPIAAWYDNQREAGRVLNYGAVGCLDLRPCFGTGKSETGQPNLKWFQDAYALTQWVGMCPRTSSRSRSSSMIERGIKDGSIGIGLNSGYAPGYGYKEVLAVHQLAAKYGVPTFTHIRNLSKVDPDSSVQAYGELISYATAAGSHVHVCHLNSTSLTDISLAVRIIRDAQERGANISVEAYPYGAGSGAVNAAMFQPGNMKRMGSKAEDIEYLGQAADERETAPDAKGVAG